MDTMNSAAALSSTREDSLKKLVFAGIFAALTYIVLSSAVSTGERAALSALRSRTSWIPFTLCRRQSHL